MVFHHFALALFLALPLSTAAWSQPASNFDSVNLALGGVAPVGEAYSGLWDAGLGPSTRAAAPFYAGRLEIGLHAFPNASDEPDLPDFLALRGAVGWGVPLELALDLRLVAGLATGALMMRFDSEDGRFGGALQNETELTTTFYARLDRPIRSPLRAFVAFDYTHVYTAEPIRLSFIQAGLSIETTTPRWLRRALR